MEKRSLIIIFFFFFFFFSLLAGNQGVEGSFNRHPRFSNFRPTKLFVFGDSYADTGNNAKSLGGSWKIPYGITFPGKPAGRFSDGRVLTDYLAKFVGVKSPLPYKWRKFGSKRLQYGMNFAYGGTGVFKTIVPEPNMTTQIDFLQELMKESVYTTADLQSSVALVTLAGNDYSAFVAKNTSNQALLSFIPQVVNQLAVNLKRIHGLGVKKVAVTALQPLGCVPRITAASSFKSCSATQNAAVNFHNFLLHRAVAKLNNQTNDDYSSFLILDLYSSFMSVLHKKGHHQAGGSSKFGINPLKPCCMGISKDYSCGSINEKGEKMYTICDDPESAFFWDGVHPTQEGWRAVYSALLSTLQELY